jgi:hypothetical protein
MTMTSRLMSFVVFSTALALVGAQSAQAMTITGTVAAQKYLVTGSPVSVNLTNAVLKISFETTTPGVNLSLCAGTIADFSAGRCATQLNDSGGPGFRFLTIVDAASLNGKQLYIIKNVGFIPASFSLTIE